MTYSDELSFDDPALKRALARACPVISTPSQLRRRIETALKTAEFSPTISYAAETNGLRIVDDGSSGTMRINPQTMTANGWSTLLPGMAIAASMLITIGLMAYFLSGSAQAMPQKFEAAAIARHDQCCGAADHHLPVIRNASYSEIGRYLKQELNHPVLAADLSRDGWQFSGAAICPISGVPTAHLLFRKGPETLSVFSLPTSAIPSLPQHQSLHGSTKDGHAVVVRAENGALYCLVGHGDGSSLDVDALDNLFDKHSTEATVAEISGPRISVAGITREP